MLTYEEYRHRATIENNVDVIKACELADDYYSDASVELSEDLQTAYNWLLMARSYMPVGTTEDLEIFLAGLRSEGKVDEDV